MTSEKKDWQVASPSFFANTLDKQKLILYYMYYKEQYNEDKRKDDEEWKKERSVRNSLLFI